VRVVTTRHALLRRNPLARFVAAGVLGAGLLVAVDLVTPGLVLAVELAVLPFAGIAPGRLARRCAPVLVALVPLVLGNAVFSGRTDGAVLLDAGPILLTTGGLLAGLATGLRLVAIALPGLVVALVTDPVELADALVQQARVPPRFAYGTLAALRLAPLLAREWQVLGRARRARGLDAGRNPATALRLFAGRAFALLVGAVRHGTRLATAMDARGFDADVPRSAARPSRWEPADTALVAAAAAVCVAASAASAALGSYDALLW
jgi:energy-coupling factor transport system permease protein